MFLIKVVSIVLIMKFGFSPGVVHNLGSYVPQSLGSKVIILFWFVWDFLFQLEPPTSLEPPLSPINQKIVTLARMTVNVTKKNDARILLDLQKEPLQFISVYNRFCIIFQRWF